MIQLLHYLTLTDSVFDLRVLYQELLLHGFQGEFPFSRLVNDSEDPAKRTLTNSLEYLEVLELCFV